VHRYGQTIGFATQAIRPGDYVHTHNLGMQTPAGEHDLGTDVPPRSPLCGNVQAVEYVPENERRTFLGYKRADGRVGTRNVIAVISTVNCSAHATREIARLARRRYLAPDRPAAHPNVDDVVAFTHHLGCSAPIGSPDYVQLQRTLAGIARHPNVGAAILVGLGCESNQAADLVRNRGLCHDEGGTGRTCPILLIQELGGIRKTIKAGVATVESLIPAVNAVQRTPQPISELVVALQCGGSDGWSGVTANPVVGLVADEIVRQGGTVVLGETTESYGAEHLLTSRAVSPEVGRKLLKKVCWWEEYARKMGLEVDNNRSVGNEAGGLTTIYEKALGAVAKGGSTPLIAVYDYAEPVSARGLTFMDTPGNDWTAVTGQIAGGCTLVLFTTGRGSAFGSKPAPTIKISSNSATYEHMIDDMDLNAGRILDGADMEEVAAELTDLVIAVASGQPSKSEAQGVGEAEFSPWSLGRTL